MKRATRGSWASLPKIDFTPEIQAQLIKRLPFAGVRLAVSRCSMQLLANGELLLTTDDRWALGILPTRIPLIEEAARQLLHRPVRVRLVEEVRR